MCQENNRAPSDFGDIKYSNLKNHYNNSYETIRKNGSARWLVEKQTAVTTYKKLLLFIFARYSIDQSKNSTERVVASELELTYDWLWRVPHDGSDYSETDRTVHPYAAGTVCVYKQISDQIRGLVKLKKNPKIREKLGLDRPHPPTPLSNFVL